MKKLIQKVLLAVAILGVTFAPGANAGQIFTGPQAVNVSMNVTASVTLSCSPASLTFTYDPVAATGTASGPITCASTWALDSSKSQFYTYVYVSSTTAALTNGSTNIPASDVFATINGGSTSPCTGTDGTLGAVITPGTLCGNFGWNFPGTPLTGSGTNTIVLSMANLPQLSAGTYTGVVTIAGESQ